MLKRGEITANDARCRNENRGALENQAPRGSVFGSVEKSTCLLLR